ncbi:MAG: hypothetical protein RLN76_07455 [Phycisphaeraceae bacterium]
MALREVLIETEDRAADAERQLAEAELRWLRAGGALSEVRGQ